MGSVGQRKNEGDVEIREPEKKRKEEPRGKEVERRRNHKEKRSVTHKLQS